MTGFFLVPKLPRLPFSRCPSEKRLSAQVPATHGTVGHVAVGPGWILEGCRA